MTFWDKNTNKKSKTGRENGKYLHSSAKLPRGADISWNEGDPDCTEDQHGESDELGLVEVIGQFTSQKSENKAQDGQQAEIANDSPEP